MSAYRIADDVYAVGVQDPELSFFDIVMETKYGTSYNAYLVKGEKTALIDTVKKKLTDEYLNNVREVMPPEEIDYLIVNHTEPDHSGALPTLVQLNPKIKIICSAPAVPFVKNILNTEADLTGIKDDHLLELGGKTLQFKLMPYMHWPDTMMDFLTEDGILFSNDGFAAHVSSSESIWSDESTVDIDHEVYYYWDAIMRPFSGYIRRNLPKLDALDIRMVAPSHGPLYRTEPRRYIEQYKQWTRDKTEGRNGIALFYASNYGNTRHMAQALAEALKEHGYDVTLADAADCDEETAKVMIEANKAVVIGTPTFNGDAVKPIWELVNLFSTVYAIGKKAAVFGNYGWGGEGAKLVGARLAGLKLKLLDHEYRARLIPSEDDMSALNQYADELAAFFG